ncbi:murein transglycosylase A [Varunaivibrio sulfuroxidans]|uniref:peptidoglycan lytic exotransglycosylase n=1 Tax=Varunaivibrio sulfuroxidans TaxID=1773489 RepID=A0A4R3JH93_9PROT|nr:MltA domain-containing protein [Varunaivibrio sulfuroxidans]TCS64875.1 membrane-bound lytic murein transglycosylase A [Varunaivibrio sulfuroxidans]WES29828.1 MltA domain-containing protein [Varunaivibrio sulfuroxidans]
MKLYGKRVLTVGMLVALAGCAAAVPPPPPPPAKLPPPSLPSTQLPRLQLTASGFGRLAGWGDDGAVRDALAAFRVSCAKILTLPPTQSLMRGAPPVLPGARAGDWAKPCRAARDTPLAKVPARRFFETWFTPYLVSLGGRSEGLFTGYYEAELHGSSHRHGRYRYPVYGLPTDLVTADLAQFSSHLPKRKLYGRVKNGRFVPYYTRGAIDNGALKGKARVLLWVDDPVDAFFLHVQGSGRVRMDDGSVVRLGFAGRNGHRYRSIGKVLIGRGEMTADRASMASIRAWVKARPKKGRALLAQNPSYIFFKKTSGDGGPIGALGVPLTPGRSLAVDRHFIPMGMPIWLETTHAKIKGRLFRRLMIAQDTGGAITGAVRGDVFFGFGTAAARLAGSMKDSGRYYLLLPRPRPWPR